MIRSVVSFRDIDAALSHLSSIPTLSTRDLQGEDLKHWRNCQLAADILQETNHFRLLEQKRQKLEPPTQIIPGTVGEYLFGKNNASVKSVYYQLFVQYIIGRCTGG